MSNIYTYGLTIKNLGFLFNEIEQIKKRSQNKDNTWLLYNWMSGKAIIYHSLIPLKKAQLCGIKYDFITICLIEYILTSQDIANKIAEIMAYYSALNYSANASLQNIKLILENDPVLKKCKTCGYRFIELNYYESCSGCEGIDAFEKTLSKANKIFT